MADLSYQVTVDTNPGIQSLQKLQNTVSKTNQVFDKLKASLAGLAVGGFIQQAYAYADAIDDIAKSSNLAIADVVGFSKALESNGGRSDAAAAALATFTANISEAADGSAGLQDAFARLNISLSDLATLSEQQLLSKVVTQLGKVDNTSLRAALSTQIFGRALKGVDLKGFAGDYAGFVAGSQGSAAGIAAAAQASDNFQKALSTFKIELLGALKPVSELAAKLLEVGSATKSVIRFVLDFAIALASLYAGFRLIKIGIAIFGSLGSVFAYLSTSVANLYRMVVALLNPLTRSNLFKNWAEAGGIFAALRVTIGAVTEGVMIGIKALAVFFATIYAGWQQIKDFFGWGEKSKEDSEKAAKGDEAAAKAAREVQDAYAKKAQEIKAVTDAFVKQNAAVIDQINLDNELLGKSKEYSDVVKAQEALFKRSGDEINKLRDAKEQLSAQEQRAGLDKVYDEQIAKIQELAKVEAERIKRAIENANKLQQAEEFRLYGIRAQQDAEDKLLLIQREMADVTLTDIEKKYLDIARAADDSAKAAIRAEEARRGAPLSDAEIKKYYETARKGSQELVNAQKKLYDSSRTFSSGWTKAFKEYKDAASNAASAATRVFDKFTQGLEDLFVEFAKTGKFEWKNFVNSIMEELLRSQIKQTLANVLSIQNPLSSGGGSIGDMFGGIFGSILGSGGQRGQSASQPLYVVDVGSAAGRLGSGGVLGKAGAASTGGGIFDTIGNAFSSITSGIGSIFGGTAGKYGTNTASQQSRMLYDQEAGMGGGFFDSIGSGISSAVSGISDFFGGFFANGGTIPANKFGIVGERGPELIGGPANITPMGMGSVTYNINAVDAASFKALVAADPGFIHAVAMKGAGSVPARR